MSIFNRIKDGSLALLHFLIKDAIELLFNVGFVVVLGIFAYLFRKDTLNIQAWRAFDFKDDTLNYLHRPSVISGNENIVISTFYGIIASLIGNAIIRICQERNSYKSGQQTYTVELKSSSSLHKLQNITKFSPEGKVRLYRLVWGIVYLIVAVVETNVITNFTKTSMGVLKPHFLTECKPDSVLTEQIYKTTGSSWINETMTMTICTNKDTDYRRSFPSGHASQAAVGIAYGFLEVNDFPKYLVFTRLIQMIGVLYAIGIWTLRIKNNQHHWPDVLVGAILGVLVATSAYLMKEKQVKRQYRMSAYKQVSESSDGENVALKEASPEKLIESGPI